MTATFHVGDAIEVMGKLLEKSVDLILTSPPFLALRSYLPSDHPDKKLEGGSQSTPGEYIDWLLDVVEACDRVLAPHGSLCVELGDTYAGSGGAGGDYTGGGLRQGEPKYGGSAERGRTLKDGDPSWRDLAGYYEASYRANGGAGWPLAKSLSLIPESFRFAMVYGHNPHTGRTTEPWRLRNVIRWVRPNPPVGALGDKFRPATSELMVFCKSAKRYFDLDAVRVPVAPHTAKYEGQRGEGPKKGNPDRADNGLIEYGNNPAGAPPLDWWNIPPGGYVVSLDGEEEPYGPKAPEHRMSSGGGSAISAGVPRGVRGDLQSNPGGAPPLDWWEIPPGGFGGAHYAVWPPELCVKPVKAMCPEKVCRVCGEPSRRIVESERHLGPRVDGADRRRLDDAVEIGTAWLKNPTDASYMTHHGTTTRTEMGFSDCGHDDWRPGVVLDPFAGSGTTLAVATGHGRDAIGIDLDARNVALARDRVGSLFFEVIDARSETDRSDYPLLAEGEAGK